MSINKISHNNDTNIFGNVIGDRNSVFIGNVNINLLELREHFQRTFKEPIDWTYRESGMFNDIIRDEEETVLPIRRELLLNETLENFIKISYRYNVRPCVRSYGYFSSFSTIRQPSETSDIAIYERNEKKYLMEMARKGFDIKIIVNLQLEDIYNSVYTYEQCKMRCEDLVKTLKELQYCKNVSIVYDDCNSMDSMWILDTLIVFKAEPYNISVSYENFNSTFVSSSRQKIKSIIRNFDEKFETLKRSNDRNNFNLKIDNNADMISLICKARLNDL